MPRRLGLRAEHLRCAVMRRAAIALVLSLAACTSGGDAVETPSAVLVLGDSNVVLGAQAIVQGFSEADYVIVVSARVGDRTGDARVPNVETSATVVNLGVNDIPTPAAFDPDALMRQLSGPVLWTNLPCTLEPPHTLERCETVNARLAEADRRWDNLTVLDWAAAAEGHNAYMTPGDIHLTVVGQVAWAQLVVDAVAASRA